MPWARFDDDYLTNTKMLAADKDALLLHVASVVYCAKRLTDGFVPATALKALAVMGKVAEPDPAVANLVELNLWQVVDDGWRISDDPAWRVDGDFDLFDRMRAEARRQHALIIFERDGYRCLACGASADLTLDHIIALSRGGTNDQDNLQTLCRSCNSRKGAR